MAAATAALANDGRLMVPHVVAARIQPGGEPEPIAPRLVRQVVTPGTARAVRAMLAEVVSGRVTQAAVPGYSVGGKTGTSQIAEGGVYATDGTIASFAGFAPVSAPRIAGVAVVNDPSNGEYYGGPVAAPLFSAVMSGAMRLMNVAPDNYQRMVASNDSAGGGQ